MSAFKALNVDSDQESEDEVDNTKEIQIEETLKLYQTALKFHSEGPASFPQADAAYKALFKSEIFKYQESLSEFRRHELYGDSLVFDTILDDIETEPTQPAVTNDSGANTLHQVLHLSYKNHGQFMLETMQHWIKEYGIDRAPRNETTAHILSALTCFAESLDKDDTDLDLWLRAASVAALLGSRRITRFCLEAVLDGDDELVDSVLRLPGLEEGFAGQQLRELVEKLEDTVSLMQAPLSTMSRKKLSETLKKRLNPYPFAPLPSEVAQSIPLGHLKDPSPRIIFKPSKWDWAGLGEAILHNYHAEQSGFVIAPLGSAVCIDIPSGIPSNADNAERSETENAQAKEPTPVPVVEDSIQRELAAHEDTPEQQSPEASAPPSTTEQDVVMEDQPNDNGETDAPQEATSAPSRKRSTDSAGFPETAEGGRARSKRLRARDSIADGLAATETVATDGVKQFEEKLYPYSHADKCLFEIINDILERLGIEGMGSPKELKDRLSDAQANGESNAGSETAEFDMYTLLQGGTAQAAAVILSTEHVDLGGMSREAGLNAFLGYAKANSSQACSKPDLVDQRLLQFAADVNEKWLSVQEVALAWLEVLLRPGTLPNPTNAPEDRQSSYVQYRWAEDLKRHLVQIIVHFDETIYEAFQSRINKLDSAILGARTQSKDYALSQWDRDQIDMAQTLFELHLDIYSLIRHPHSGVDSFTQVSQKDRLGRWSILARDALQLRSECHPNNSLDNLAIRHIWASVFHLSVDDEVQPDHVIQAMEELKSLLRSLDGPVIELQNNAVMPDLSIAAVDRELARISMKDFFLKVFEQEDNDPVAVIESLEPILETTEARLAAEAEGRKIPNGEDKSRSASPSTASPTGEVSGDSHAELSPFNEMRRFLEATSVHLKLSLWQRLREAYETIEYTPKVVSCYLRSIETLVGDFKTSGYTENSPSERQMTLLTRFRIIDEIILRTLQIIKSDKTAFDALSYEHVQTSIKALAELLRVLWAGNMLEDMVRVGQLPGPRFEGFHHTTFQAITNKLHDLQLRTWVLQYYLLKEGISQTPEAFSTPSEEQFEFLRHVHHATGVRGFCHFAKWIFLRLAKDELLRLDDVIDGNTRDNELSQVLYDLYGLKVFVNPTDCLEFYSNNEILDKRSALQLLSFVQSQARKTNIKDLSKTELKVSIDKVHGCLGRPKTNEDISHNRKVLTTYFKSAINPISLFECLKGVGTLSTKSISPEVAIPASKGWYFLMGNIALNKFRSQKRLNPGPTEDLNFAQAFFLQDLEYSVDRWETWYRLAQVYDSQLEEAVSWTAEKLNSNSLELMNFQRGAINCYTLATACAVRDADAAPQTLSEISELYTDFGNRIYSSSREPFAMTAFTVRDAEQKYYSGDQQRLLYQNLPFHPLQPYTAWKFASVLFKRAIQGKPDKWWNHYMLAKCLWKMYCHNANAVYYAIQRGELPPVLKGPTREDVITAVVNSIDALPEKRERGREPILEPHYKLIAIVHKLFKRKDINHTEGEEILQNTSYSKNISGPESADDWERYILSVLKALKTADKSSWHHRMIMRTAHIIYEGDPKDPMLARGAKHELTQQMFTKTMSVQVWKPENERPGRHFVYTTRYTRFFIQLLEQTNDKSNMELLARRVRRKQLDFFEHSELWRDICQVYLHLLRRLGNIPSGHEDTIFRSLNQEEFAIQANRLEAYCQSVAEPDPVLEVMRDATELKRINNGLLRLHPIDDLIGDSYALLYSTIGPNLPPLPSEQAQQPQPPAHSANPLAPSGPELQPLPSLPHQVDGAPDPKTLPALPFAPYPPTAAQPANPPGRSRTKAVPHREILRRAEAASLKPIAPAPVSTVMAIRSPPASHTQLNLPLGGPSPEAQEQDPEPVAPAPPSPSPKPDEQDQSQSQSQSQSALPSEAPTRRASPSAATAAEAEAEAEAQVHRPSYISLNAMDDDEEESELSELDDEEVREIQEECDIRDPVVAVSIAD